MQDGYAHPGDGDAHRAGWPLASARCGRPSSRMAARVGEMRTPFLQDGRPRLRDGDAHHAGRRAHTAGRQDGHAHQGDDCPRLSERCPHRADNLDLLPFFSNRPGPWQKPSSPRTYLSRDLEAATQVTLLGGSFTPATLTTHRVASAICSRSRTRVGKLALVGLLVGSRSKSRDPQARGAETAAGDTSDATTGAWSLVPTSASTWQLVASRPRPTLARM
jgi:hypothetical protein